MDSTPSHEDFEALIKELAQVTVAHVNKELRRKKWGLKSAKWKSAFAEENGGENNTDPRVGKFRVVLPNGKVFAKLDLPIEGADVMVRIWRIKDQVFAKKKWYGLKVTVKPDGEYQCEFTYDPRCLGNLDFFNS